MENSSENSPEVKQDGEMHDYPQLPFVPLMYDMMFPEEGMHFMHPPFAAIAPGAFGPEHLAAQTQRQIEEYEKHRLIFAETFFGAIEKIANQNDIRGFASEDRPKAIEVQQYRDLLKPLSDAAEAVCLQDPDLVHLSQSFENLSESCSDRLTPPYGSNVWDSGLHSSTSNSSNDFFENSTSYRRYIINPESVHSFPEYMIQCKEYINKLDVGNVDLNENSDFNDANSSITNNYLLHAARSLYKMAALRVINVLMEQYETRKTLIAITHCSLSAFQCAHNQSWTAPFNHIRNLDVQFARSWNTLETNLAATFTLQMHSLRARMKENTIFLNKFSCESKLDNDSDNDFRTCEDADCSSIPRTKKHNFDQPALCVLRAAYAKDKYPSEKDKNVVARLCNLSIDQVNVWFTNRRSRDKKREMKDRHRLDKSHDSLLDHVPYDNCFLQK